MGALAETDAMAGTQPLRSAFNGTNAQGALHRGKHSWAGNTGTRPQLCLPETVINTRGALLSLFTTRVSRAGRVKCFHWTNVLAKQGKDEQINCSSADAFTEILASQLGYQNNFP